MAEKVPMWMSTAAQVATGNRKMVLEDGPDVMNSDKDNGPKEDHEEVLTGMYTSEMDPNLGPQKLSPAQVAAQKAAAQEPKARNVPPRSQSPIGGSSDEDEPTGSEWIWSQTKGCMRGNKSFRDRASTAGSKVQTVSKPTPAPQKGTPEEKKTGSKGPRAVNQSREEQKNQNHWKPENKRAELEACDQGEVQGKRIRVLHKETLPKPES
jgi:hypothetical protein